MPDHAARSWTIRFKNYLPVDDQMGERLQRVCEDIDKLPASALHVDEGACVITIDYAKVRGWAEASRQVLRATRVGQRIVVKPPWEDYARGDGDIVLEIDPGACFGSGLHESTRLCLMALEKHVRPGCEAVDFGTGSGIQAIAAVRLGARRVTAFDADMDAVEAARANVERNGLELEIEVREGRSPEFVHSPVDLVIANITAEVISRNLGVIGGILRSGGLLAASGMTRLNAPGVEHLLPGEGFDVVEKLTEGQWVAIVAARQ